MWCLGDIDVELSERIGPEDGAHGPVAFHLRPMADAVQLQAAMQRRLRQCGIVAWSA